MSSHMWSEFINRCVLSVHNMPGHELSSVFLELSKCSINVTVFICEELVGSMERIVGL